MAVWGDDLLWIGAGLGFGLWAAGVTGQLRSLKDRLDAIERQLKPAASVGQLRRHAEAAEFRTTESLTDLGEPPASPPGGEHNG